MDKNFNNLLNTPYFLCEKDFLYRINDFKEQLAKNENIITTFDNNTYSMDTSPNFFKINKIELNFKGDLQKPKEHERILKNYSHIDFLIKDFYSNLHSALDFMLIHIPTSPKIEKIINRFYNKHYYDGTPWRGQTSFQKEDIEPLINSLHFIINKLCENSAFSNELKDLANKSVLDIKSSRSLTPLINLIEIYHYTHIGNKEFNLIML